MRGLSLGFFFLGAACSGDISTDDSTTQPDANVVFTCDPADDTCGGDNICIVDSCQPAFGRDYDLTNITVTLPATQANGMPWDPEVGAENPDLVLEIMINTAIIATTPTTDNVLTATWAGPFTVAMAAGNSLSLTVYDDEGDVNSNAYACNAAPVTSGTLRSRGGACMNPAGAMLSFTIQPK
jgi:hypothetical protein